MSEPTDLERRLEALEHELRRVTNELSAQRASPTLRRDGRCPSCDGRRFLHAPTVLDRSESGRDEMAIAKPSVWREATFGTLEAYACLGCGWVEWYVKAPATLEELPSKMEQFVIYDTTNPPRGDYR